MDLHQFELAKWRCQFRIGGDEFFATQGTAKKLASLSVETCREFLKTLQQAGLLESGKPLGNFNSLSHAEAMALMDASGTILAHNKKVVHIYVDRITCDWCKNDKGLMALKKFLGIDELVIFDSTGRGVRFGAASEVKEFLWHAGHLIPLP